MSRAGELRKLRLAKRLTQQEVADKMNISQSYYVHIEAGRKKADVAWAVEVVSGMRLRGYRTEGGLKKAGRRVA